MFSIEKAPGQPGIYSIAIVFAPGLDIAKGTPAGSFRATADPLVFDAVMSVDPRIKRNKTHKNLEFQLKFNSDFNRLAFVPYSRNWRVNLNRLLPYFFRISVERPKEKPEGLDAAFKIAPESIIEL